MSNPGDAPAPERPARPRPIAIAVVRRGDAVLVGCGTEPVTGVSYWRPLGGGVEYGERSEDALRREFREEVGAELADVRPLAVLENVFTYAGETRHEIIFVYEARFPDAALYALDELPMLEAGWAPVRWVPVHDFADGRERLVPDGLLALLVGPPGG